MPADSGLPAEPEETPGKDTKGPVLLRDVFFICVFWKLLTEDNSPLRLYHQLELQITVRYLLKAQDKTLRRKKINKSYFILCGFCFSKCPYLLIRFSAFPPHVFNFPALLLLWETQSFEQSLNQEPAEAWESRTKKIVEQPGLKAWHTPDTTPAGSHVRMYITHT